MIKRYTAFIALLLILPLAQAANTQLEDLKGEHWYGLYMNGQKTGYLVSSITVEEDGTASFEETASSTPSSPSRVAMAS